MTTAKGRRRHVPPSRARYEATHKTVSARLDPELQHELDLLKSKSGMSTADVIRVGLDKAKPNIDAAYHRGVEDGFEEAREFFEVRFPCSQCGLWHQAITTDELKAAAAEFMFQQGWFDIECRFELDEAT
jgi:hypothetical protein